jgi:hypothetical protein
MALAEVEATAMALEKKSYAEDLALPDADKHPHLVLSPKQANRHIIE